MAHAGTIDIQDFINAHPFSRFQRNILIFRFPVLLSMQFFKQSIFLMAAVPALVRALGWHRRRRAVQAVGAIHIA